MTYEEREALIKYHKDLDKELLNSESHIITTYINIKNGEEDIPVVSAIYDPEEGWDGDLLLTRSVTSRVTEKIHHLSIFEEFEKSYLIAYPLGEEVEWDFSMKDFFQDKIVKLAVHSKVYHATNYSNNGISHREASGLTYYDVKLFPVCTLVEEDSNIFIDKKDRCYAICAIQEIVSEKYGCNGSFGTDNIESFFKDNEKILNRIDTENGIPYPEDISVSIPILQNGLKGRIIKAREVISLKKLPTIGLESEDKELSINIKYLDREMPKAQIIDNGDWIDLCTAEDISLRKGDFRLIPLGVIIQIPEGYEALLLPRSSTFKKWGILVANSMGVIDNSYRGPEDQWMLAAYATKDIVIPKYTRIAQFRLLKNQPKIVFHEIDEITDESRGGFGSTGE